MRRDLICSVALLCVAAVYYRLARNIGETALADAVGPAGLPLIYAIALATIAAAIGIGALLRHRLRAASGDAYAPDTVPAGRRLRRAAGALAIGIAYIFVVPLIGYPFAIALTIATMAVYQGEAPTYRLLLVACIGAAALFVLFDRVLGVPMPAPWSA